MVNKDNKAEDEPSSLKWVWRPENIDSTVVQGKGDFSVNGIVDQKAMANDQSDYLWLMTRILINFLISLLGSQWAGYPSNSDKFDQRFVFETNVKLKEGKNLITLLSATVGFKNYGGKYDLIEAGVLAPIELVAHKGENTTVKDLSNQKWSYKIGLEGVENKIYDTECPSNVKWSSDNLPTNRNMTWSSDNLPTNRNMTWYKTTFKAPLGDKPVVVDLLGLGKGHAWVNNHSLGRYWPSYIVNETLCQTEVCDYRGTYSDSKCRSGCGQPTQRRYHVPRSFIKDGENTLVLFEEFGGDPSRVKFETVEVGSACVNAHVGKTVELSCYDRPISRIAFASFGNPQGECGSFAKGEAESSADVAKIIEKECVGKEACNFEVSERKFGKAYCNVKKLAVEAMTMYANNATGEKFCFLSNVNGQDDTTFDLQQDGQFFVPAWSVTILQNCNKEIYNSAKINSQISVMVKKPEEQPPKLTWMWAPEAMRDTLKGQGKFKASLLLDQKEATFDVSDYLWYMTSVDINDTIWQSWKTATLLVSTNGHALHAFVNSKLIGSQFSRQASGKQMVKGDDYSFVFEKPVSLNLGTNIISLLSATVGLTNYGEWYDLKPTGLVGGSVQLVNGNNTIDLTTSNWSYKVGLNNELNKRLYDPQSSQAKLFVADKVPIGRPLTWYKTSFQAPLGSEPVVVDLQGMGKGHAWVNGNSIGRYWPSQIADADGCNTCDYRGGYSDSRCRSNCGNPSQRWYHVPRSFLNNGTNTLILFEEIGGNMTDISFQIVTVGTVCGSAYEGSTLELACQGGRTIAEIQSATFGDPQAKCGPFKSGSSSVQNKSNSLAPACAGKTSCSIDVSTATFGSSSSGSGATRKLVVQAVCS
ncbi:hypothetical protein CCACVL1_20761 [Corchorus capsularis]|uniref:SUEL-type lectin domain-containing protein n=1 Tax=Corchorus capsularis TaxID=210143 RepID=A0A1R3HA25_COCAP|nr:hypothetical protein CCACVL1_20761 [Corchorus capsularis]